jgi:hypothetical protein
MASSDRGLKGGGEGCELRTLYRTCRSRRPLERLLVMEQYNRSDLGRTLCAFGHLVRVVMCFDLDGVFTMLSFRIFDTLTFCGLHFFFSTT